MEVTREHKREKEMTGEKAERYRGLDKATGTGRFSCGVGFSSGEEMLQGELSGEVQDGVAV